MVGALTKSIGELTSQDVEELISLEVQEGETVEFKEALSSNDHKNSILKEVVAFANGYGGRIFIGIAERSGSPSIAAEVRPVLDCANLADQIGRACADLIDPPVLSLDVHGVATEQDGSGVIVIDVPRSIRAPHMSRRGHRAYRRRGSESVPMDMRDIQDMVLRGNSRYTEIETEFYRREREFANYLSSLQGIAGFGYCLRLSFVPMDEIDLGRRYRNPDIIPDLAHLSATFSHSPTERFWIQFPQQYFENRPTVRGVSRRNNSFIRDRGRDVLKMDIWSNGGLETWFGQNEETNGTLRLYADWLVKLFANGLRNIERIRRIANLPSVAYGSEAKLSVFGKPVILYDFGEIEILTHRGSISIGDHVLPCSEVGPIDDFNGLVNQFVEDWFNVAGRDWSREIVLDYGLD